MIIAFNKYLFHFGFKKCFAAGYRETLRTQFPNKNGCFFLDHSSLFTSYRVYYKICTHTTRNIEYNYSKQAWNDVRPERKRTMKKQQKQPSIYEYNDFRKFLADYQNARVTSEQTFTKSEFSRLLDLPNTRSYFTDVLKGKRVTQTFVERFIKVIRFSRDEAQFFSTLVRFNQARSIEERELAFRQLIDLNRTPSRILDKKMVEYYSHWYNSVVRALLEVEAFTGDYTALARKIRPAVSERLVRRTIKLLLELGLAHKDTDGVIKPAEKSICASENLKKELVRHFQLQVIALIQKKMMETPVEMDFSLTNTISLSRHGYQRLIKLLEQFQGQLRSLIHKDEGSADRVMMLSAALTTVSKQENL